MPNIRTVVLSASGVLGAIFLASILATVSHVVRDLRDLQWIAAADGVVDSALRTAVATGRERGATAILLATPTGSRPALAAELADIRGEADRLYRGLLAEAAALEDDGGLVQEGLSRLKEVHGVLEQARLDADRAIRGEGPPLDPVTFFEAASGCIMALGGLQRAVMTPLDDRARGAPGGALTKRALFMAAEFSGRERAALGAVIAEGRTLRPDERAGLAGYRAIVEAALQDIDFGIRHFQGDSAIIDAHVRMAAGFGGEFEALRRAVLAAANGALPYPVDAGQWFGGATHGIDSIVAFAEALNRRVAERSAAAEREAWRTAAWLIGMTAVMLVASLVAGAMLHWRGYLRLRRLQEDARYFASGDLSRPVEVSGTDELGELGEAFEDMRGRLLRSIGERERIADELRGTLDRFRGMVETTHDWLWEVDADGRYTYASPQVRDLLGYEPGEVLGRTPFDLMPPEEVERIGRIFAEMVRERSACRGLENVNLHRDGRRVVLETSAVPILDERGALKGFRGIDRDVTDRKQAERQLAQSEKLASIGQLAAGVAHEINNPVGYIASNLSSLERYIADLYRLVERYEAAEAALDPAERAAVRALKAEIDLGYLREDLKALLAESAEGLSRVKKIVSDLKDFSRIEDAEWQAADLHQGLESTLNIVRNEIKYKADVVREYGELPSVNCVPAQINQVFMNLLVNAAQAIEQHGTITIRTGTKDGWAWVEVEDTGKGIVPEHQKQIFDPFFTTKPVGKGTGLGLAVSYGIVERHGGRVEVDSEPGRGTRFRVWLPVERGGES